MSTTKSKELENIYGKSEIAFEFYFGSDNIFFINVQENKILQIDDKNLENLLKVATESSFGSYTEQKNILDKQIRVSYEIKASDLFFYDQKENSFIYLSNSKLITDLQRGLKTLLQRNIKVVPYKLNIYTKGSFFKKHVDSLKSPYNIGTLLLGFSDNYEGGLLKINHKDKLKTLKITKNNCVFLYGSCEHEVTEVLDGIRLILAFDVYSEDPIEPVPVTVKESVTVEEEPKESDSDSDSESEDSDYFYLLKSIVKKLREPLNKDKEYVAITLDHYYAVSYPCTEYDGVPSSKSSLKGPDLKLYDYFQKAGGGFIEFTELAKKQTDSRSSIKNLDIKGDLYIKENEDSYPDCITLCVSKYGNTLMIGDLWNEKSRSPKPRRNKNSDSDSESDSGSCYSDCYAGNEYCSNYYYYGSLAIVLKSSSLLEFYERNKK